VAIEIRGGDKFEALLKKLMEKYPDILDISMDDLAAAIHLDAARYCPVDEGTLRNSINVRSGDRKWIIGTAMEYAPYVEYGGDAYPERLGKGPGKSAKGDGGPFPFMRTGFQLNKKRAAEFFMNNLSDL